MVESVHYILEKIDQNFELNPASIVAIKNTSRIKFTWGWTFTKDEVDPNLMNLFESLNADDGNALTKAITKLQANIKEEITDFKADSEHENNTDSIENSSHHQTILELEQKIKFYNTLKNKNGILVQNGIIHSVLALSKAFFLLNNPKFATESSWTPVQIAIIKITSEFDNPDSLTEFNQNAEPKCDLEKSSLNDCVKGIVKEAVNKALAGSEKLKILKNLENEIKKLEENKFFKIEEAKTAYLENSNLDQTALLKIDDRRSLI